MGLNLAFLSYSEDLHLYSRFYHGFLSHWSSQGHHLDWIGLENRGLKRNRETGPLKNLIYDLNNGNYDLVLLDFTAHSILGPLHLLQKKHPITCPNLVVLAPGFNQFFPKVFGKDEKNLLQGAQAILLPNFEAKDFLEKNLKSYGKIKVFSLGLENESLISFSQLQDRLSETDTIRLLVVQDLVASSNLDLLLQRLTGFLGLSWELDVVGDETIDRQFSRKLKKITKNLGLQERVVFWGNLGGEDLDRAFRRAHVLVIPGPGFENQLVVQKSLDLGMCVLSSGWLGSRDFIKSELNGFSMGTWDNQAWQAGFQRVFTNKSDLLRMGANALKQSQNFTSWSHAYGEIQDFLESLVL